MEPRLLIGIVIIAAAAILGGAILLIFLKSRESQDVRGMMDSLKAGEGGVGALKQALKEDKSGAVLEKIKAETRKRDSAKKKGLTLDEKLFRAGMFTQRDKMEFVRIRIISPLISVPLFGFLFGVPAGLDFGLIGVAFGLAVGYQFPFSFLDRKIKKRNDEIMFYLPLVIEQISIGVSSSLDIGPCLARVVQMADERDTHNCVTELLRYAQNYIKSGVPFEDAMIETGKASGHTELKHAFMYLSQVARHGGEITRQLQELADSVSTQRQTHIEGKIKKLEVIATGPVSLVFLGFMLMLLTGFGIQLKNAF